jgi:hypothetical protein
MATGWSSPPTRSEISDPVERVTKRVSRLAGDYEPPDFAHVPDPDAALFLCASDHRTGYRTGHLLDGRGPFEGSELLWEVGLRSARRRPGSLAAPALVDVGADEVAEMFRIDDETVFDPERRAELWRDLAAGVIRDYSGSATELLTASGGLLGGGSGLLERLRRFEAYSDPLAKKSFLFAKIAERRGWLRVSDPGAWEVCADNVLMRLALRSGLIEPGELDDVRSATREAFKQVANRAGVSPPVLDDLLWELGRDDPDLLGADAGDLKEPARDQAKPWY